MKYHVNLLSKYSHNFVGSFIIEHNKFQHLQQPATVLRATFHRFISFKGPKRISKLFLIITTSQFESSIWQCTTGPPRNREPFWRFRSKAVCSDKSHDLHFNMQNFQSFQNSVPHLERDKFRNDMIIILQNINLANYRSDFVRNLSVKIERTYRLVISEFCV